MFLFGLISISISLFLNFVGVIGVLQGENSGETLLSIVCLFIGWLFGLAGLNEVFKFLGISLGA